MPVAPGGFARKTAQGGLQLTATSLFFLVPDLEFSQISVEYFAFVVFDLESD